LDSRKIGKKSDLRQKKETDETVENVTYLPNPVLRPR